MTRPLADRITTTATRIEALRIEYRQRLESRLEGLSEKLSAAVTRPEELDAAYRLAHNLSGTIACYGFTEVSAEIEEIEALLQGLVRGDLAPAVDAWRSIAGHLDLARSLTRRMNEADGAASGAVSDKRISG